MIALLDTVILDVGPCLSWLWILLSRPFLPVRFLLRNPQIVLWELLCSDCLLFSCCFEGSLLKFNLGQCNYDVPSCVLPWVQLLWDSELPGLPGSLFPVTDWGSSPSLCFQISFQFLALPLLLLAPLWFGCGMFTVVPEVPQPLLIFLNSCFFILIWLNVYFFLLAQTIDIYI